MSEISLISLNDGGHIPQLGLGTSPLTDDEVQAAALAAFEIGYRHIDTASSYHNEAGVGRAVNGSGLPREEVFVTTKLDNADHAARRVRPALEASLEKLGLDYVDLYLIHWPMPERGLYVDAWEQLIDLRSAGLARSIGVSNFLSEHLDQIINETGIAPSVNQFELHPTLQDEELINYCNDAQIAVEAYAPMGFRHDLEDPAIIRIAEETGTTPAKVILSWHISRGFIAIPKSGNPERIRQNYQAAQVRLAPEQLEIIDGMHRGHRVWGDPRVVN